MKTKVDTQTVIAYVILRKLNGSSVVDINIPITAETITAYQVEQVVIEKTVEKLTALGFEVLHQGPVSVTIKGNQRLFETIFHAKLINCAVESNNNAHGTLITEFIIVKPIRIPVDLVLLVADVSLSTRQLMLT